MKNLSLIGLDQETLSSNLDIIINYEIEPLKDDSVDVVRYMICVDDITYSVALNTADNNIELIEAYIIVESKASNYYAHLLDLQNNELFCNAVVDHISRKILDDLESEAEETKILNRYG